MTTNKNHEFIFQLFALILAVIVVHSVYVTLIRPQANALIEAQLAREAAGEPYVAERSFYVVVKDYEQESCFVLMFWAMAIMGYKARRSLRERNLLSQSIVKLAEGTRILPEDARQLSRPIQALPREQQGFLAARAIDAALQRFSATRNIQDVSSAVTEVC